eukprot:scaffold1858_cov261-Pinguiococcus_pyrenoidosus.AAC.4
MGVPQQLTLARAWIAAKKHVDFAPRTVPTVVTAAVLLFRFLFDAMAAHEPLPHAAEQLTQNPFLHVGHLPDGRGQRAAEDVIQILTLAQVADFLHPLRTEAIPGLAVIPALVVVPRLLEVNHVDVGAVHTGDRPAFGVRALRYGPVDARDLHAIAGSHKVYEIVKGEDGHGRRRLPLRHLLGRFLEDGDTDGKRETERETERERKRERERVRG